MCARLVPGVEGALLAAVEKQMLAVTWFQKEARKRTCVRRYAYARLVVIKTQASLRRNHAKILVRRRLAVIRKVSRSSERLLTHIEAGFVV